LLLAQADLVVVHLELILYLLASLLPLVVVALALQAVLVAGAVAQELADKDLTAVATCQAREVAAVAVQPTVFLLLAFQAVALVHLMVVMVVLGLLLALLEALLFTQVAVEVVKMCLLGLAVLALTVLVGVVQLIVEVAAKEQQQTVRLLLVNLVDLA
jgi:hypothetical protein